MRHIISRAANRALSIVGSLCVVLAVTGLAVSSSVVRTSGFPVPKAGHAYYGVQLDWLRDSINGYASRLGRTPALYGIYVNYPISAQDKQAITTDVQQLASHKSTLMLTLEPYGGLSTVSQGNLDALTTDLKTWNGQGVPILVRFAHEMDGSWYPWAQQPTAYVPTFRKVADAVHKAPASGMLWSPNEGGGYPFTGGKYEAKPGTADFAALDTNHDGKLTMADDPYAPFYPGDKYVDWVGLSVYHFGRVWPWGGNYVPDIGKFAAKITGTYKSQYVDETALPNFYAEYAEGHHKPFAISETGALYVPTRSDGANETDIKTAWINQVYDPTLITRFPQLKLIAWFEHKKQEHDAAPSPVDWRLSVNPVILDRLKQSLPDWMVFGK